MKGDTVAEAIGARGEERICTILSSIPNARLYRNVYIPRRNGGTVEIDAVLLSSSGLLIVECKTFLHGTVAGSIQRYEWTRTYRKKGSCAPVRTKFYNPIKQNAAHVEAAARALSLPRKACHSIVVFAQGVILKKIPPSTSDHTVTQEGALRSVAIKRLAESTYRFPPEERKRVEALLESMSRVERQTKKNHMAFAKQAHQHRLAKREHRKRAGD